MAAPSALAQDRQRVQVNGVMLSRMPEMCEQEHKSERKRKSIFRKYLKQLKQVN